MGWADRIRRVQFALINMSTVFAGTTQKRVPGDSSLLRSCVLVTNEDPVWFPVGSELMKVNLKILISTFYPFQWN